MQFMTTLLPRPMPVIVFQGFLPENLAASLLYVFHILLIHGRIVPFLVWLLSIIYCFCICSTIGDESFRKQTFEDYVSHLKEQSKRIKQNKKVMVHLCL